jgi:hypothetical protein
MVRGRRVATGIAVISVVLLSACGGSGSSGKTAKKGRVVNGSVTLQSTGDWSYNEADLVSVGTEERLAKGSSCYGNEGFSDITSGAEVTVFNESGTVIGTGSLDAGQVDGDATVGKNTNPANPRFGERLSPEGASCEFSFTVNSLPTAKFYRFKVSHRDGPNFSFDDLVSQNWMPRLSL